jgi:hypothetical protein
VRLDTATALKFFLSKYDGSTNDYAFYHDPTNGFTFRCGNAADVKVGSPGTGFSIYHVVGWYDSSDNKNRLRINDTTTYVTATAGTLHTPNTAALTLGAIVTAANSQNWEGLLGQVGFWKRKLTAGEITALYGAGAGLPFSSFTP